MMDTVDIFLNGLFENDGDLSEMRLGFLSVKQLDHSIIDLCTYNVVNMKRTVVYYVVLCFLFVTISLDF